MQTTKDYAKGVITEDVFIDGYRYCFSAYPDFDPEAVEDEQLDYSGNVIVLAITPQGTKMFTIHGNREDELPHRLDEKQYRCFNQLPKEYQEAILAAADRLEP